MGHGGRGGGPGQGQVMVLSTYLLANNNWQTLLGNPRISQRTHHTPYHYTTDTNTKCQTGRTAQLANIQAAKAVASMLAILPLDSEWQETIPVTED
jgi:hypothetical protein